MSTANRFVIAANGAGAGQSVWLDVVQAIGPTFQATGSLRRDLEQLMADTRPGFFRVPGGNYLEGAVIANRFAWKNTIGPVEQRPGHQNDAWGYWSTDQFGLLNYLQMAEQAGAEPMLGVFAGYTLNGSVTPQGEMQQYVQEALDEIEYVTGGTNTTWGARRAAVTSVIAAGSSAADKLDASFVLRPGLAGAACYSLEARNFPGQYLRHQAFRVKLAANDGSALFAADATFCAADGNGGPGVSLRSYNFPTRFLRHYNSEVWIAANGGTAAYDSATNWAADTTWRIGTPWFRSDVSVAGGFHSLRATTPGFTDRYVRHQSSLGVLSQISASSPVLDREDATFDVVPGLADNTCYSFESRNFPGRYLRHNDYRVKLAASDGSAVFNADATFCAKAGVRFQSYNFPDMYLRHYNSDLWIASNGGARPSDNPANYVADTTWVVTAPLG
ncbi:AbfB domain-containing protein [Dactylosporangium sp. CA-152071]|uniref:AbfB domain-containing protein n=1 Tax=Dactylosporangium sp. CA-152071 TaxID=3239933 RepID=UPI003D94AE54